jgi:DeoR family fructose operon transcriptional repressor
MRIERLNSLVEYINIHNTVSFSQLCKEFDTSSATMRRDLNELEQKGVIERIHGGAKSLKSKQVYEPPFDQRENMNLAEKQRIAKYAFSQIANQDSVILDSSTTISELAKLIAASDLKITVITNDVKIAYIVASNPSINLINVGGTVRQGFYTSLGLFAEAMWKQLHADKLFLGIDAIHPVFGMLNYRIEEISSKRLMIGGSNTTIVLCDHTKFSSSAVLQICPLENVHSVITGTEVEDKFTQMYKDTNLKIVRV